MRTLNDNHRVFLRHRSRFHVHHPNHMESEKEKVRIEYFVLVVLAVYGALLYIAYPPRSEPAGQHRRVEEVQDPMEESERGWSAVEGYWYPLFLDDWKAGGETTWMVEEDHPKMSPKSWD